MKIYEISKGQLYSLWIFAILFILGDFFYLGDSYETNEIALLLIVLVPAILVFYTLGWRKAHNVTGNIFNRFFKQKDAITQEKQKKSGNAWGMFWFVLSFIALLGRVVDPGFGFITPEGESDSYVGVSLLYYIIFVASALSILKTAKQRDAEIAQTGASMKGFETSYARTGIGIGICVLLLLGIGFFTHPSSNTSDEVQLVLEDALYGTNQSNNPEVTNVVRGALSAEKNYITSKMSDVYALDDSDVLEYSSLKTSAKLDQTILMLEGAVAELEQAPAITTEAYAEGRTVIVNSSIDEDLKAGIIKGFNTAVTDTEKVTLTNTRYTALKNTYSETLKLYLFLRNNFNDYSFDFDENGEEQIYFYTDANIDTYNSYSTSIQYASQIFANADKALLDYTSSKLADQGLTLTAEQMRDALYGL